MIDPLWRRAPLLLRAYPAAAVALVLASAVLAAVASSGPAFLASSADAALHRELETRTANQSGLVLSATGTAAPESVGAVDSLITARLEGVARLGEPVLTVTSTRVGGYPPMLADVDGTTGEVWLVARTGAIDALVPVDASGNEVATRTIRTRGVWVPQPLAADLGLDEGDLLTLRRADASVVVPVLGFYRVPEAEDADGYWVDVASQLASRLTVNPTLNEGRASQVPSPLFTTPDQVAELTGQLGGQVDVAWEVPLDTSGLTLAEAQSVLDDYGSLGAELADPESAIAVAVNEFHASRVILKASSTLSATVGQAIATRDALEPALRTLTLMGTALGLALVAAAAVVLIRRRSTETRMLEAQGIGVTTRAARSAIETLPAILIGGALGWALGLLVVAAVPPVLPLARTTVESAAVTTGWALAIALATVVLATAWAAGRPETLVPRKVRSAPVPWEIGLVLLAGLAGYELVHGGSTGDSGGDLLTLAFPLLLLSGVSVLGARLLTSASAGPARWSRRWPFPAYLAARRVAGGAASTRLLVAVVAVATGMAVYGTVLVASTRASLEEKALIANGAEVNAFLGKGMGLSCTFATQGEPMTPWQFVMGGEAALGICPGWDPSPDDWDRQVLATVTPAGIDPAVLPPDAAMIVSVDVRARPSPYRARLLIVDPVTYAHVTGATEIADVISETARSSSRIPGATSGTPRSGPLPAQVSIELAGTLTRVGLTSFDAVPGMGEDGATIVVEASQFFGSALPQVFGDPRGLVNLLSDSAWSTGDPASLEAALLAVGAPAESMTTTDDVLSRPDFRAQDWSLAYLQILAASAAALAVGALLLNLAERQRSRSLASAMVRRMGATRRTMRASIALELAALLGAGVVLGLVLGIAAGAFVASNVDPLSAAPPTRGGRPAGPAARRHRRGGRRGSAERPDPRPGHRAR